MSGSASEIAPDVEAAAQLGIAVITREILDRAVDQTLQQPDADRYYVNAERAVSAALSGASESMI